MTSIPRDQSRDRRIEDPTNRWVIHPLAHALLPWAIRAGLSANVVSVAGLALGAGAALAFARYPLGGGFATLGLALAACWLVADGLDGMIARATGTASPLGRVLDGLCDHGVFVLIYLSLGAAVGTMQGWLLMLAAGVAHALHSNLYEAERARFHRRAKGDPGTMAPVRTRMLLERAYNGITAWFDRAAAGFDRALAASRDPRAMGRDYAARATPALRLLALESANVRVLAIWVACMIGDPRLFWWFEIGPLTLIAVVGIMFHRRAERALIQEN